MKKKLIRCSGSPLNLARRTGSCVCVWGGGRALALQSRAIICFGCKEAGARDDAACRQPGVGCRHRPPTCMAMLSLAPSPSPPKPSGTHLRCHAHGAGVGVALAHHDAAKAARRGGAGGSGAGAWGRGRGARAGGQPGQQQSPHQPPGQQTALARAVSQPAPAGRIASSGTMDAPPPPTHTHPSTHPPAHPPHPTPPEPSRDQRCRGEAKLFGAQQPGDGHIAPRLQLAIYLQAQRARQRGEGGVSLEAGARGWGVGWVGGGLIGRSGGAAEALPRPLPHPYLQSGAPAQVVGHQCLVRLCQAQLPGQASALDGGPLGGALIVFWGVGKQGWRSGGAG